MAFHKFSLCNAKHKLLSLKVFYIHTHKNKVMLFLKIEEKYWFIWTCQVEKSTDFILINLGFQKFENRQANLALDFGNTNFTFKIRRIKSFIIKDWKEKLIYIDSGLRNMIGIITITNQFHKFSHCNDERTL
jgi:hypothetical protein